MDDSITFPRLAGSAAERARAKHWALRYGLAVAVFAVTVGLSLLLIWFGIRISFAIPILVGLVGVVWYGGRGPGILLSILFHGTTIYFTPIPPDSTMPKIIFGYFSVFTVYLFLVWVISGLKDAQARLRSQRDLLQVTLSSIGDAVIATDTQGQITFMNPAAEALTGWTSAESEGRKLNTVVRVLHEDTRSEVQTPVEKVLESGSAAGLMNHSLLLTRDGREVPIDNSAAPIKFNGKTRGAVFVISDASERKQAERSRRETEIMHRLVDAQEAERRRIARDLQDHLGQQMTALRLKIETLTDDCVGNKSLATAMNEVKESAVTIDRDIGFLSWELRPTELENFGLANALSTFVREWSKQHGIAAEFHAFSATFDYEQERLPEPVETNLYRIAQEALNNVRKHAAATNVSVLLQVKENVTLIVEDDGLGFDRSGEWAMRASPGSLGLISMQERAELLKGDLEIDSSRGSGTTVRARVPLNAAGSKQV
jgi:PAS domain S-box-containing protein